MEKQPLSFVWFGKTVRVICLKLVDYGNGGTAVQAQIDYGNPDDDYEEQIISVWVNGFTNENLTRDEFYCKHYSELEQLYKALVAGSWLKPIGKLAKTGFVMVPACTVGPAAVVNDQRQNLPAIET